MAVGDTRVKFVTPDMTRQEFIDDLKAWNSPAASVGGPVYDHCVKRTLLPSFLSGVFKEESSKGTNKDAICVSNNGGMGPTRSWGNTTEPSYGHPGLGPPFVRDRFTRYPDWYAGGISTVDRLFDKVEYWDKQTVRELIYVWAPPNDNNRTEDYIAGVEREIAKLGKGRGVPMAEPKIIDIRDQLPTNPRAKGGQKIVRAATQGQVLHYSAVNYADTRSIMEILKGEAAYHINPNRENALNERGLAYHWTVDWRDGTIYLCRDEDESLWHCGYWGPGGNGTGLAIHVPGGPNLRMSQTAIQSLLWLAGRNERKYGFGRGAFKGHLEVSQTDCPGPLMATVVRPYRAGQINYEGTSMSKTPIVDPVTGHTVHPELTDTWKFEVHGRPLLPACLYSDGIIRQLFERAVLAVGQEGGPDTIETLGHAFLYLAGDAKRYPEWPGVHPLV